LTDVELAAPLLSWLPATYLARSHLIGGACGSISIDATSVSLLILALRFFDGA
jgi:hypothetical protein